MRKNIFSYIAVSVFSVSVIGTSLFLHQEKSRINRIYNKLTQLVLEQDQRLHKVQDSYKLKYVFLKKILAISSVKVKSKVLSELNSTISLLEEFRINTQASLDSFEERNNKLNQLLSEEVISFDRQQPSVFTKEEQIRNLERFDKHIDLTRSDYSLWSFKFFLKKKEIERSLFIKHKNLSQVLYFKIDHLIRQKKDLKRYSKSLSLTN